MGIQQDHITPTGETKSYHRLGGSFEKGSPLFVTINSYPDKAARDSGACPWMEPVVIPWKEWSDIYDAIAPMLYEKLNAYGYDGPDVEEPATEHAAEVVAEVIEEEGACPQALGRDGEGLIHKGQTQADIDAKKKTEALNAELTGLASECERLSAKIVRPLVAMQDGSATDEDRAYFDEYNGKLKAARARMAEIKTELGNKREGA